MSKIEKIAHITVIVFSVVAVGAMARRWTLANTTTVWAKAGKLDRQGKSEAARRLIQHQIEASLTVPNRVDALRWVAVSWAFEGNCTMAGVYEQRAIDAAAASASEMRYLQQAEIANEAGRICLETGELDRAATWYKKGYEVAAVEPNFGGNSKALAEFRLAHAEARIAVRRNDRRLAEAKLATAAAALNGMTDELRLNQSWHLDLLRGYISFYSGEYLTAIADLRKSNLGNSFVQCLLGQAYDKVGKPAEAAKYYRSAAGSIRHDAGTAIAQAFARRRLRELSR
jgi:tetratricopeptide (TPR) repeat protein